MTEEEEFAKYSGMEGLLEFYREECGLVVYNRAIPDFKIPTSGDLVNNILDLTYHLSKVGNYAVVLMLIHRPMYLYRTKS